MKQFTNIIIQVIQIYIYNLFPSILEVYSKMDHSTENLENLPIKIETKTSILNLVMLAYLKSIFKSYSKYLIYYIPKKSQSLLQIP